MKKHLKIIITIIICFLTLWLCMFVTDSIKCKNDQKPCFSIKVAAYKDGGSQKYLGLFYNYYKVVNIEINIETEAVIKEVDYVITPWFFDIGYAKEKAIGE